MVAQVNYQAIAADEAQASKELASQNTYANRPTQITPWGTNDWGVETVWDHANQQEVPYWTQTTTLDPMDQKALDQQQAAGYNVSNLANKQAYRANRDMANPINWNQFGDAAQLEFDPTQLRQQATDAAYDYGASRLDPRMEEGAEAMEVKMRGQGLRPGDQAYDRAMGNFNRNKEDAYNQLTNSSFMAGQSEAGQLFGQQERAADYFNATRQSDMTNAMTERGQRLNEMTGLMQGQQVGMPAQPSFRGANVGDTPDMMGAGMQQYQGNLDASNQKQASNQGWMAGAASLIPAVASFF